MRNFKQEGVFEWIVSSTVLITLLLVSTGSAQNIRVKDIDKFFSRDISQGLLDSLDKLNSELLGRSSQIPIQNDSERDLDIWVIQPEQNSEPYPLTIDSEWDDQMPQWSPRDQRIAYVSSRTGRKKIWLMNSDGTKKKQLSQGEGRDLYPRWSPDAQRIAFVRDNSLYAITVSNGAEKLIATSGKVENICSWSRDGGSVLVVIKDKKSKLVEIDLSTGSKTPVDLEPSLKNIWTTIKLHPTSELVVYQDYRDDNFDIAILNFNGNRTKYLTDSFKKDFQPAWSPDGSKIVFASNRSTPIFN